MRDHKRRVFEPVERFAIGNRWVVWRQNRHIDRGCACQAAAVFGNRIGEACSADEIGIRGEADELLAVDNLERSGAVHALADAGKGEGIAFRINVIGKKGSR